MASPETAGPTLVAQPDELSIENPLAPGKQSPFYEAAIDDATLENGRPTMRLSSTDGATASGFGATTAVRKIDDSVAGRRYRMRAKIKTEDATAAWLWWRIDGGGFYQIDNMGTPIDRRIRGTKDWQELLLVMDVPPRAVDFAFGCGLTGTGKVWVSTITFEHVSDDVPVTPSFGNGD